VGVPNASERVRALPAATLAANGSCPRSTIALSTASPPSSRAEVDYPISNCSNGGAVSLTFSFAGSRSILLNVTCVNRKHYGVLKMRACETVDFAAKPHTLRPLGGAARMTNEWLERTV
jgi:hypothetical protein